MKSLDTVTFLSDFGGGWGYVAACEATIARISPGVRLFHMSHDIPVGDVAAAALVLARIAPLYPEAVHLAVVDPGVGTLRRPLALSTARGDFLVGPDNGLLLEVAAALGGLASGWTLDMKKVRSIAGLPSEGTSTTFHGRDLFAPASALLATGVEPRSLGDPLDPGSLVRLPPALAKFVDEGIYAGVTEIDRFGNIGLGLPFADLSRAGGVNGAFLIEVPRATAPERTARMVQTYGELASGELGLLRDSWAQTAIVLKGASAAEALGLSRGVMIMLKPVGKVHS